GSQSAGRVRLDACAAALEEIHLSQCYADEKRSTVEFEGCRLISAVVQTMSPTAPPEATEDQIKVGTAPKSKGSSKKKIWIDLDNSPHVPFFIPIKKELEHRGYDVLLTARDAYQVSDLVEFYGLQCKKIGRHFGKNKFFKVAGVVS